MFELIYNNVIYEMTDRSREVLASFGMLKDLYNDETIFELTPPTTLLHSDEVYKVVCAVLTLADEEN